MSTNEQNFSKKNVGDDGDDDCNCYAERRARQACLPLRNVTHPLRYYEFTEEEVRALEECDRESFYRRCLPLSAALGLAALAAVRNGLVKSNKHFGAVPKVLAGVVLGHVLGRLTYLGACERRLRRLPPQSHLGQVMRAYHNERNQPAGDKKNI